MFQFLQKSVLAFTIVFVFTGLSRANAAEWLVKLSDSVQPQQVSDYLKQRGVSVLSVENLRFNSWYLVNTATENLTIHEGRKVGQLPGTRWVEPNKVIRPYQHQYPPARRSENAPKDPIFQKRPQSQGADPMMKSQWALEDVGMHNIPSDLRGNPKVIVAVIDTGVDYNHVDLNPNIWTNPGEAGPLANNGKDDDNNGYIDDFMGWDFSDNDNLPYDRKSFMGNPGHGTHCAGVIGARADNGVGIRGIAPNVTIMPIRFLSERGEGTVAGAVKSLKYAIEMGAWITSNSWGGPEDTNDPDSQILREIFQESAKRGRLSIVAAGNEGLNIDRKPELATPASFNYPGMMTVAATTPQGSIAGFSNYGANLVQLAAPGVKIYSTTPNDSYANLDGTSMAAPMVSGAAALFWSKNPNMPAEKVRSAILSSTSAIPGLAGRVQTNGKLNVEALMSQPTERVRW